MPSAYTRTARLVGGASGGTALAGRHAAAALAAPLPRCPFGSARCWLLMPAARGFLAMGPERLRQ